jgi:hypothetical protein
MKLKFPRQVYERSWNIQCHENPSSGSRVLPSGRTRGRADMTKLTVALRDFANAPQKHSLQKQNIRKSIRKHTEIIGRCSVRAHRKIPYEINTFWLNEFGEQDFGVKQKVSIPSGQRICKRKYAVKYISKGKGKVHPSTGSEGLYRP